MFNGSFAEMGTAISRIEIIIPIVQISKSERKDIDLGFCQFL